MILRKIREDFNLKQEDLAKVLNCSQVKISNIETGRLNLQIDDLAKLIKALNLTSEYYEKLILDYSQEKNQEK